MSDETSGESDHSTVKSHDRKDNITTRRSRKMRVPIVPNLDVTRIKVPSFSPDDPEIWFALLEGQFENFGVTDDKAKFNFVISNLDLHHAKEVKDLIINPPPSNKYNKIKHELIRRLSASHEKKVKQLLSHEQLGDRKPSQFLRHLQDLAGPAVPQEFVRTIWSNRLPSCIQTVLASQTSQNMEELSDLADRIQEITQPNNIAAASTSTTHAQPSSEIAELKQMVERLSMKLDEHTRGACNISNRSRPQQQHHPPSRPRSRSNSSYRKYPLCWYHSRHGVNARKCIKPCDFEKSGNAAGSR